MIAINQDKADKPIVSVANGLGNAFLAPLGLIPTSSYRIIRWLQDERRCNAAIRELNRLNDHYLNDIGINRNSIELRDIELMKHLRAGG